ncbi:MAG: GntR family transcriptional regulator [Pseudomonadota bacterium]
MAAESQTTQTYEALKSELLDGQFQPGSKLKIDQIRERCNASPGAVREALSRLTSDGLVVSLPQRGFIVAPISSEDLVDLTAVRIEIETNCLRSAIEHGDLAWEGRIQAAWHQLKHTPLLSEDGQTFNRDWTEAHGLFHDTLIDACTSKWWLKLREQMFIQAERYRRILVSLAKRRHRDVDSEHEGIVTATLARDANLACERLEAHLQRTMDHLLDAATPLFAHEEIHLPGPPKSLQFR